MLKLWRILGKGIFGDVYRNWYVCSYMYFWVRIRYYNGGYCKEFNKNNILVNALVNMVVNM